MADVSRTSTSVKATLAKMAPTAPIVSTATRAPAHPASVASTVRSTPTTALTVLASTEAPVWMESTLSPACVCQDSPAATASTISMSVTQNRV